jgi:DNA polymerase III delta prime subunit
MKVLLDAKNIGLTAIKMHNANAVCLFLLSCKASWYVISIPIKPRARDDILSVV